MLSSKITCIVYIYGVHRAFIISPAVGSIPHDYMSRGVPTEEPDVCLPMVAVPSSTAFCIFHIDPIRRSRGEAPYSQTTRRACSTDLDFLLAPSSQMVVSISSFPS